MLVDTGSDRVVLFGGNFEAIGWPGLRNFSPLGTSLADQEMRVGEFFASDILLAGQHFRKDKAYFIQGSKDSAFDGLLGVRTRLSGRLLRSDEADPLFAKIAARPGIFIISRLAISPKVEQPNCCGSICSGP